MVRKLIIGLVLLTAFALAACGGPAGDSVSIEDPWVRPAPIEGGNGAAYMVIQNGTDSDDALLSAESDIADSVEIHESMMAEDEGEMMSMQPVDRIDVPAGGSAELAPGGYHIMLIGMHQQLAEGDTVALTLHFENAGTVSVEAPVKEQ
jgi:copper(I)-binding protein